MNKYLKLNLIICTVCGLLVYYGCTSNQALAANPITNNNKVDSNGIQQDLTNGYYTQILKQLAQLNKNAMPTKNLIDSNGRTDEHQLNKLIDSAHINNEQITKSLGFIKGLVYDPNNPGPFFNNMIGLQTISLSAQSQLISVAEKSLGAKNSYVISLKENYNRSEKYLEAIKLQKVLLEQSIQASHK